MSLPGDIARTEFRLVRLPARLFTGALSGNWGLGLQLLRCGRLQSLPCMHGWDGAPRADARRVSAPAHPSPCARCRWYKSKSVSLVQVASYNGWEYAVLERELGAHRDPSRKMLVTVRKG